MKNRRLLSLFVTLTFAMNTVSAGFNQAHAATPTQSEPYSAQADNLIHEATNLRKRSLALQNILNVLKAPKSMSGGILTLAFNNEELKTVTDLNLELRSHSSFISQGPLETIFYFNNGKSPQENHQQIHSSAQDKLNALTLNYLDWTSRYETLEFELLTHGWGSFANQLFQAKNHLLNPSMNAEALLNSEKTVLDLTNDSKTAALLADEVAQGRDNSLELFIQAGIRLSLEQERLKELKNLFQIDQNQLSKNEKPATVAIILRSDDLLLNKVGNFSDPGLGKKLLRLADHYQVDDKGNIKLWFDFSKGHVASLTSDSLDARNELLSTIDESEKILEFQEGKREGELNEKVQKAVNTGSVEALKILFNSVRLFLGPDFSSYANILKGNYPRSESIEKSFLFDMNGADAATQKKIGLRNTKTGFFHPVFKVFNKIDGEPLWESALVLSCLATLGGYIWGMHYGDVHHWQYGNQILLPFYTGAAGMVGGVLSTTGILALLDAIKNSGRISKRNYNKLKLDVEKIAAQNFIATSPADEEILEILRQYVEKYHPHETFITPQEKLQMHMTLLKQYRRQFEIVNSKLGFGAVLVNRTNFGTLSKKIVSQLEVGALRVDLSDSESFYIFKTPEASQRFEEVSGKLLAALDVVLKTQDPQAILGAIDNGIEVKVSQSERPDVEKFPRSAVQKNNKMDPNLKARLKAAESAQEKCGNILPKLTVIE